jgi:hypothetical protein
MNAPITRFEFHKAQKVAATLLLAFLVQSLWVADHLPLDMAETRNALAGKSLWSSHPLLRSQSPLIPGDSILALRCAGALPSVAETSVFEAQRFNVYAAPNRFLLRLPFVLFGLWLGAGLWWVSRRTFGTEGAYIALALYCFSPGMLLTSSTADPAILAAWGLFGLVYTAIGVAHTLYAPARKWRPRIALLGVAIGLTAAASTAAAVAGIALAALAMMYLAPGRRIASTFILIGASILGAAVLLLCFGLNVRNFAAAIVAPTSQYLRFTAGRLATFAAVPGGLLEIFVFASAASVFLLWRRTRYFGNAAPLLVTVFLSCWPGRFIPAASLAWALPFAFVLVGGIYADLLEQHFFGGTFRKLVLVSAGVVLIASAVQSLMLVLRS